MVVATPLSKWPVRFCLASRELAMFSANSATFLDCGVRGVGGGLEEEEERRQKRGGGVSLG